MSVEVDLSGRFYCSITAAAKDLGMSPNLLRKYIATGRKLDPITIVPKKKGHSTKPIPVVINGKAFSSIAEAARYYNVTYPTFYLEIKRAKIESSWITASAYCVRTEAGVEYRGNILMVDLKNPLNLLQDEKAPELIIPEKPVS